MERLVSSLSVRLISVVLVILAALVPPLYLGVSAIVRDGYAERFVNSLRAYSRLVADELEAIDGPDFERRAVAVLDSAVLSGQVVFAEVRDYMYLEQLESLDVALGQGRTDPSTWTQSSPAFVNNVTAHLGLTFFLPADFEYHLPR